MQIDAPQLDVSDLPSVLDGDQLDWQHNACVGEQAPDCSVEFYYAEGYLRAARHLIKSVIGERTTGDLSIDLVAYPIVMLYRHHLELSIKMLIRRCQLMQGVAPTEKNTHSLISLWESADNHLRQCFPSGDWANNAKVRAFILDWNTVDPNGQVGRYAFSLAKRDVPAQKSFEGQRVLNMRLYAEWCERISWYISSICSGLSYLIETQAEHDDVLRQMYPEAYEAEGDFY